MKNQVTKDVIFSYFSGHATAIQKQVIDEWVKEHNNREVFYQYLQDWEKQHPQYLADVENAYALHQRRMLSQAPGRGRNYFLKKTSFRSSIDLIPWSVAASIAMILLGGWYFRTNILNRSYNTSYGETRQISLTDGSKVTLNSNSSLTVPRFGFTGLSREVFLRGEAIFLVTHTEDNNPFLVKTGQGFEVKVLGTEFAVYNRTGGRNVVLNRGKVLLRYDINKAAKSIMMKPGDMVKLDEKDNARILKIRRPENLLAWRDNRFVFENTSLTEISKLFADNYGIRLVISDDKLAEWTVSGSFTAHNADELLETLMQAASLTYTRIGNQITVTANTN